MLSAVAPNATPSVTRPPYSMRENRSRPSSSVPNQWFQLGGLKALAGIDGVRPVGRQERRRDDGEHDHGENGHRDHGTRLPAQLETATARYGQPDADHRVAHAADLASSLCRGSSAAYRTSTTSEVTMNAALTRTTTLCRML